MNKNPDAVKQYLVDRIGRAGAELCEIMSSETAVLPVTGEDKLYVAVGTLEGIAKVAGSGKAVLTDEQIIELAQSWDLLSIQDGGRLDRSALIGFVREIATPASADNPSTAGAAKGGITSIEGLTRYDYVPGESGRMIIGQEENGMYLLRADVERLLATPASQAQPSAAEVRDQALEEAARICESEDQKYEIGRYCAVAIRALKGQSALGEKGGDDA